MLLNKIVKTPIYNIVKKTSLDYCPIISKNLNNKIFLKREDQQIVKSFKIRGAHQYISSLSQSELNKGIIAASAGNHAQGVALSANELNCSSTIVMPVVTPSIKWKSVKNYGAEIVLHGDTFDEAYKFALQKSEEDNLTFVHPFDHDDIIAGQGTIGLEIINQFDFRNNKLDAIFIPVGGGGLISGIGYFIKKFYPEVKIIGIEPKNANAMQESLNENKLIELDYIDTFADGVAVKKVGSKTFEYCKEYVDDIITCTTDEICTAIQNIFEETRIIAEPAGALSIAGATKYIETNGCLNKNYITILSGANMNFTRLRYIAERSIKDEYLFAVNIDERPGSLQKLCNLLENNNITEFNYRYNRKDKGTIFIGILTDNKDDLLKNLSDNYNIIDISDNKLAKDHTRYQVCGNYLDEELIYTFEFPEKQGALTNFLAKMSEVSNNKWNITMFHYRSNGASVANVLCGLNVKEKDYILFSDFIKKLGYNCNCVNKNEVVNLFYNSGL